MFSSFASSPPFRKGIVLQSLSRQRKKSEPNLPALDCLVFLGFELTYKTATGKVANELLYRHDEPRIEVVEIGRPWSFDGDGAFVPLGL